VLGDGLMGGQRSVLPLYGIHEHDATTKYGGLLGTRGSLLSVDRARALPYAL
jgi:hypothetical protein